MKKTKKQLIKEIQKVYDLVDRLDERCNILLVRSEELTKDLEVRKFKEKAKGEKYIVKMYAIPFGLKLEVSFLDKEEENVIQCYETLPGYYSYFVIDHKINENYVELYKDNEIIMVYKITDIKLEEVDLELYKKAYPYSVNLKKNVCEGINKIVDFMKKDREEKLNKSKEELKNKKTTIDMSGMPKEDIRVTPRKEI